MIRAGYVVAPGAMFFDTVTQCTMVVRDVSVHLDSDAGVHCILVAYGPFGTQASAAVFIETVQRYIRSGRWLHQEGEEGRGAS